MSDCLFCRIVDGDLPSTAVGSTERSYAFRDIHPQAPTHVLVVPRRHITNADELRAEHAEDLIDVFLLARQVAHAEGLVRDGLDPSMAGGYRLLFNVGRDAGNMVPHLHLHVLGGRRLGWPPG